MLTSRLTLPALIAFALMTGACATPAPQFAPPPRLETPAEAERPCRLPVLPDAATFADLETVYVERGAALVACEEARQAVIDTLATERQMITDWLATLRPG